MMSASLIGRLGSSTFRPFTTYSDRSPLIVSMSPAGSRFSSSRVFCLNVTMRPGRRLTASSKLQAVQLSFIEP